MVIEVIESTDLRQDSLFTGVKYILVKFDEFVCVLKSPSSSGKSAVVWTSASKHTYTCHCESC